MASVASKRQAAREVIDILTEVSVLLVGRQHLSSAVLHCPINRLHISRTPILIDQRSPYACP